MARGDIGFDTCAKFIERFVGDIGFDTCAKFIERFNRSDFRLLHPYKIYSIYGGSEEIMADLGIRQGLRDWSKEAKAVSKL